MAKRKMKKMMKMMKIQIVMTSGIRLLNDVTKVLTCTAEQCTLFHPP